MSGSGSPTIAVELRPPRAELDARAGLEAWIDTYHAVRGLTRDDTRVFLTDGAVGQREEDNLRHLVTNLGDDAPRSLVVPFLTTKHPLPHCLDYADRAWRAGFRSIVVLGGDRNVGPPRCVPRASELRRLIRQRQSTLRLGGWANPHADAAAQAGYLMEGADHTDFFLTQVVSHHQLPAVERFLGACREGPVRIPGVFGVFYYRSANPRTLDALAPFLPVPREALVAELAAGTSPTQVCARTIRALRDLGVDHVYISNLPVGGARQLLQEIRGQVDA